MSPFRRVNSRLCGESAIFFVTQLKVPFLSESYSLTRLKAIGVGAGRGRGVTEKNCGTAGMREKESGRDAI